MSHCLSKPVLITGCSSGIGYCVATGLKQRGYRVFATARKPSDVARLQAEGLESCELDLASSTSISKAVEFVLERTNGELYALFNNGAYGEFGALEDISRKMLRDQFETNVFGWHELVNKVLPAMRRHGQGRIIQNSSLLGFVSMPYVGAYSASKYAIESLSDVLRLELKDSGICVSLIEPGPILSNFRNAAAQTLRNHIQVEQSPHHSTYQALEQKWQTKGATEPFTLGPEAVLKAVIHALEAEQPKIRYYVTLTTHIFALLRRLLPFSCVDWVILRLKGQSNSSHST